MHVLNIDISGVCSVPLGDGKSLNYIQIMAHFIGNLDAEFTVLEKYSIEFKEHERTEMKR